MSVTRRASGKTSSHPPTEKLPKATRITRVLTTLERADGLENTAHLELTALLLDTQIAVDDSSTDLPEQAEARQVVAVLCDSHGVDATFTEAEVYEVVRVTLSRSSPGPDVIALLLMKICLGSTRGF
ncbi:hypothetical protein MRX96_047261 [Rhipicephalus microplus]